MKTLHEINLNFVASGVSTIFKDNQTNKHKQKKDIQGSEIISHFIMNDHKTLKLELFNLSKIPSEIFLFKQFYDDYFIGRYFGYIFFIAFENDKKNTTDK